MTDPSNQVSGIVKWAVTLAAGYVAARWKLDPITVASALTALGTLIWQVLHRSKVGRALDATAALGSTTDPTTISNVAKGA